jgi:S1-C subfamily serine protease
LISALTEKQILKYSIKNEREFMKKLILLLILTPMVLFAAPFHTKQQIEQISASVVKIYTAYVKPDYYSPWKKGINSASSGTGVIIKDHLILTAAHVVSDGTFIQVKKSNDAKKYTAKVKWIDHEADLALLEINDESFFDNMTAQTFGELPYRQDGVAVYGYPMGGDEISTTKGIVSRIEQTTYSHGYMDHITIQIDAPINPGNSGGPAFDSNGKIVGIAIQAISNADGIGYLVPVEVIKHFFEDIEDGKYDGYPDDGVGIQALENKNMKAFYDLGDRNGVLISNVRKNSSADGFLKKGDVILEVDGIDIAGDNTIKLKGNGRISSNYLIRSHQIGENLDVKILRDKKEMQVSFTLKGRVSLTPLLFEKEPRYYLFGGMIFTPLTVNFLKVWGSKWLSKAPSELMHIATNQQKIDRDIKELVMLNNILPNDENANYQFGFIVVSEVNGEKVTSLDHFVKLIEESKERYINILFISQDRLILDKEEAFLSDKSTMKNYGITVKQRLE